MELYHEVAAINDHAQSRLFALYEKTMNIPRENDSVVWYRTAAARGDRWAQAGLGLHYQFGKGVERNWDVAYALYNLAVRPSSRVRGDIPDFTGPPEVAKRYMTPDTWNLVNELAKPDHFLKALDEFIDYPPRRNNFIVD